jgi:hypothetical protein
MDWEACQKGWSLWCKWLVYRSTAVRGPDRGASASRGGGAARKLFVGVLAIATVVGHHLIAIVLAHVP